MPRFARTNDPATSHMASASTTEEKLSRLEELVLHIFTKGAHYTDEQLVDTIATFYNHPATPQGVRGARVKLERKGQLEVVGLAKTQFNRMARVWAIKSVA